MKEIKGSPRVMNLLTINDVLEEAKKKAANPAPPMTKEEIEERDQIIRELSSMGGFMAVSIPVPSQSGDGAEDDS